MSRDLTQTAGHAVHVAMHTETGKKVLTATGSVVASTAAALLATPAAPVVVGAGAVVGACWGIRKVAKWLGS